MQKGSRLTINGKPYEFVHDNDDQPGELKEVTVPYSPLDDPIPNGWDRVVTEISGKKYMYYVCNGLPMTALRYIG